MSTDRLASESDIVPRRHNLTFGEMEPQAKHDMSHRADAFRKFVAALNE